MLYELILHWRVFCPVQVDFPTLFKLISPSLSGLQCCRAEEILATPAHIAPLCSSATGKHFFLAQLLYRSLSLDPHFPSVLPLPSPFQGTEWPPNSNSRSANCHLQGKIYSANSSHESLKSWWKYSLLLPPSPASGNRSHHSLECSGARRLKLQIKTSHNKIEVEQLALEIVLENPMAFCNLSPIQWFISPSIQNSIFIF